MNKENNKNNLVAGDVIYVEQAWEDAAGNYHDEYAQIASIKEDGELELIFYQAPEKAQEFLRDCDSWMANDYKKDV
jgi:hypothetical protein